MRPTTVNLSGASSPALPKVAQQKLQQTLGQWRHWRSHTALTSQPEIQHVLGCGQSNHSVLVCGKNDRAQDARFVVRIDGHNSATHGLSRSTEWRVLHRAYSAGLAPQPVYFNPELGALVCTYLQADENDDISADCIGSLLRNVHTLPAVHHRLDLQQRIARYEQRIETSATGHALTLLALKPHITQHLDAALSQTQQTVLCHNDLLRANRIFSGGVLHAIDWEYCAMGPALYDIAVTVHGDGMDPLSSAQLVKAYLCREPKADEELALQHYGCVYRYVELLWYLQQAQPAVEHAWLETKLDELTSLV